MLRLSPLLCGLAGALMAAEPETTLYEMACCRNLAADAPGALRYDSGLQPS